MMKNLLFILLISVGVFGRTYYKDNHTSTKDTISSFSSSYGTEWIKQDSTQRMWDTLSGIAIKSYNNVENSMKKTFTDKNLATYPWIILKCQSHQRVSAVTVYIFSSSSETGYAYCSIDLSDTVGGVFNQDTREWYLTIDRSKYTYYNSGFSWATVNQVRIGFIAELGKTDTLFCKTLYAQTSGLSKAVILLSSDDIYSSSYYNALPIFDSTGIKTDIAICRKESAEMATMTYAQVDSMVKHGHNIVSHGWTHGYFNHMTLDSAEKEIYWNWNWIADMGWDSTYKQIEIYPHGEGSDSVQKRISSFISVGWSVESSPSKYITTPATNMLFLPRSCLYPKTLSWGTIVKKWIDTAIAHKYALPIFYHGCSDTETNVWHPDSMALMCSYLKQKIASGDLEVKISSEYFTLANSDYTQIQGNGNFYSIDSAIVAGGYINGDVEINISNDTPAVLSGLFIIGGDMTLVNGPVLINGGDTTQIDGDLTCNNTGDSVAMTGTGTAVIVVAGNFSTAAGVLWDTGNVKIIYRKRTGTIALNGATVPAIQLDSTAVTVEDGGTINRLSFGLDGLKAKFEVAKKFTFSNIDTANWNGSSGLLDSMVSSNATDACTLDFPANNSYSYMYFRDCITIAPDTLKCPYTNGCVSGGGNF